MGVGVLIAGLGQFAGVVVAFLALIGFPSAVALRARRHPPIDTRAAGMRMIVITAGAGAVGLGTAFGALNAAPVDAPLVWVLPLAAVIVMILGMLLLRRR